MNQARVLVNDFEAAFATEFVARYATTEPAQVRDSTVREARRTEQRDELALDSLVGRIDPEAVERFVVMRSWDERRDGVPGAVGVISGDGATTDEVRLRVLTAAENLDDHILARTVQLRTRIQWLEAVNVVSAAVLAPIALIAAALVFAFGRRMLFVARTADAERAALVAATEQRALLMRGVTHDIKNPLGAAFGYAALLDDGLAGELTAEQRDMVRRLRRLVGVAQDTIAELLELARLDAGALRITRAPVDVGALLRDLIRDYQPSAELKGLTLVAAAPDAPVVVQSDAVRLREVLANLLSNAIKYTPADGHVEARVVTRGDAGSWERAGVAVRDTGPGVPAELRERIFDEFFRLASADGMAPGSGLGLAISRRIARLLGGDIVVDAASADGAGGGAVFTLWVPRGNRAPAVDGPSSPPPAPAPAFDAAAHDAPAAPPHDARASG
jgi:signal transduction histidine kinase